MTRIGAMTKLRTLRYRLTLTQAELAAKARLAPATISQIERGHHSNLEVTTIRKLAAALGVEPSEVDELQAAMER